jgi:hypothetical protein
MRKLRLAIALPITQVLIASILLLWSDRTPVSPPNFAPAWLICKGMNAPAMLLMTVFGGNWYFVPSMPFVGRGLFLMSVATVWYLVGRALDQRENPRPVRKRRVATVLVVQSLILGVGALLFYAGWNELSGSFNTAVRAFPLTWSVSLMGTLLTLTWSVSLILLSGRALVRTIRGGLARSV